MQSDECIYQCMSSCLIQLLPSLWKFIIQIFIEGMYKGNKKIQDSGLSRSILNSTVLSETTNQVIERQIDNYTRLLEQDKRKFFRLQGNREEIIKDYIGKTKELDSLKSSQFVTQTVKKKSQLKLLGQELEQSINSYNDVVSKNKSLKEEIDELRKSKLNQKTTSQILAQKLGALRALINGKQKQIESKAGNIQSSRQQILKIKALNQSRANKYVSQVENARDNLSNTKSSSFLTKKKSDFDQKNQTTDTQPLVKYRLRQLIHSNKERVKVIESYQKNMNAIWKGFEDIKEQSGIDDIQQITNVFLKHEEQNHFIYEYINKLNKQLEDIGEAKEELINKINYQHELNQMYQQQAGSTPEKEELVRIDKECIQGCNRKIVDFNTFLAEGQSVVREIKKCFGFNSETQLNKFTLQDELSMIQNLIIENLNKEEKTNGLKEDVTRYTRSPPGYVQEIKDKEQKLIEGDKLRQYANDYWQKKRSKLQLK